MIVDSHAHVFRKAAQGRRQKTDYVIHEYGGGQATLITEDGEVADLVSHMRRAGVERVFVLNLFAARPSQDGRVTDFYPGDDDGAPLTLEIDDMRARVIGLNQWTIALANDVPGLEPFVALDPVIFPGDLLRSHLEDCVRLGAKGVKLHSLTQGFHASDQRLWGAYEVLQEAGLPVIAHSGAGRGDRARDAVPSAFGAVAAAFPGLKLVVAHLGGGAWREAADLAAAYPSVQFDCCEIIHWLGAPSAPSALEVVDLIEAIGVERIMLGSDFPWYALDDSVNRVLDLPRLSDEEKDMILGANAMRLLPV